MIIVGLELKILIIDRHPDCHNAIADILIERDCSLVEADGTDDALSIAHKENPDIAIVDLLTPKLNRGAFVRRLRRDPVIARIPVIFYGDRYLEIASGSARDVVTLVTPILLFEQAIRAKALGAPVTASNGKSESVGKKAEGLPQFFTFVSGSDGEHALIRPADLIIEVLDKARDTFPRSIEIATAYSDDLWLIKGDKRQLRRALDNVLEDARDTMPQGGSLFIWARNFIVDRRHASMTPGAHPGQYVKVRVSDTGNGTPRPVIDNILNPFLEQKEIRPGTTIGLIKGNGGFISVYSDFGRGTTFQIFLPAWQRSEQ